VTFFSGFGFCCEKALFREYLEEGEFVVAGFSYGAQKALKEVLSRLEEGRRVERLQLLSPAYFDHLPKALKVREIENFMRNPDLYMRLFYRKAAYPYTGDVAPFTRRPELSQLKELLFFQWKGEELERLREAGVVLEVYIGSLDKIVPPQRVAEFFKAYGTLYQIEGVGHLLR